MFVARRDELPVKDAWMLDYLEKRRGGGASPPGAGPNPATAADAASFDESSMLMSAGSFSMPDKLRGRVKHAAGGGGAVESHMEGYLMGRPPVDDTASLRSNASASSFRLPQSPAAKLRRAKGVLPQDEANAPCFFAAALECDISAVQERTLLTHMDEANTATRVAEKKVMAVLRIVCFLRMAVQRRRFVAHTSRLKSEVAALVAQRNIRCAITVQRVVRGLVCRLRYRRAREEEAMKALEAAKKGGKQAGGQPGGKKQAGAAGSSGGGVGNASLAGSNAALGALMSPQDIALQQNAAFLAGMRAFFANRWDEAQGHFELSVRQRPGDTTAVSMLETTKKKREAAVAGGSLGATMSRSQNSVAAAGGANASSASAAAAGSKRK